MKDEDKWEFAYFYLFLIQYFLITLFLTTSYISLFWTLFPLLSVLTIIIIVLIVLFIGLFLSSVRDGTHKRYMTGTGIIAVFSLLLFVLHCIDLFADGASHSILTFPFELVIAEVW